MFFVDKIYYQFLDSSNDTSQKNRNYLFTKHLLEMVWNEWV